MDEPKRRNGFGYQDAVALVGLGCIGWGCFEIYPPAAALAVGTILLAAAVVGGLRR